MDYAFAVVSKNSCKIQGHKDFLVYFVLEVL